MGSDRFQIKPFKKVQNHGSLLVVTKRVKDNLEEPLEVDGENTLTRCTTRIGYWLCLLRILRLPNAHSEMVPFSDTSIASKNGNPNPNRSSRGIVGSTILIDIKEGFLYHVIDIFCAF